VTDRASKPIAKNRRLESGLLLAAIATGVGWLALLPPFEGFDETCHYSYLQQLADTGRVPVPGRSFLSTDVLAYRAVLPTRYDDVPPFEHNGGITYREFFTVPANGEGRPWPEVARRFVPSGEPNWESQHPPLYYLLLGFVYRLTRGWSWPAHLLSLRLVSYLIAAAGLALGAAATHRHAQVLVAAAPGGGARPPLGAISLAWPFFVPMFFSEMGRLGNDSLCLLIMGAVWWQLLAVTSREPRRRDSAVLGLLLGLGLLTKALFIPIAAGAALFLALRRRWGALAVTLVVAGIVGAPWYAQAYATAGVATGTLEHRLFVEQGGLRLLAERFSVVALLRGVAASIATFVWAGTWSLARVPEGWLMPAVALPTIIFAFFVARLRRGESRVVSMLPTILVGCFAAGLLAHVLLRIALSGTGVGTPGWYAHVLAGPLALLWALGLLEASRTAWARRLIATLTAYVIAHFAVMSWLQLALYAGCTAKLGHDKQYGFPGGPGCLLDLATLERHAAVLAYPAVALPLLFGGLAAGAVLVAILIRRLSLCASAAGAAHQDPARVELSPG